MFHDAQMISVERGELFLRLGDTIESLYLLQEGAIYSYRLGTKKEKITHSFYGPADILPVAGVRGVETVSTYFEALTPVKLYALPVAEFTKQIKKDALAGYELAVQITQQYNYYVQRVGNLQYTNAYDRVGYCFLLLAERFGVALDDGSVMITIPLTHHLVASTVNVARETASRSIKRLNHKKLIKKQANAYIITDLAGLVAELHDKTIYVPPIFKGLER